MRGLIEGGGIGKLVDEAALRHHLHEIGLEGAHRSIIVYDFRRPWRQRGRVYQFGGRVSKDRGSMEGGGMRVRRAVGLMSGTSMDGIDVALLETDGERILRRGPSALHVYNTAERACLQTAIADARGLTERAARPGAVAQAERMITTLHAAAVEVFLDANGIDRGSVDVVGFHGQTVLHRPEARLTVQIGDGMELARLLGVPVVYDFRAADVAAGGQGAPLVPVYHRALVRELARPLPLAVLNIGGVANVTFIGAAGELVACDTGPGNALLDDFMRERTGEPCDRDGAAAARGRVDEALVGAILRQPFFAKECPKSLDRNAFCVDAEHLSTADGAATLTALTCAAVAAVVAHLPACPRSWIVAGGGALNPTMMRMLAQSLAPARVETAAAVGWSVAALEAEAFAFLAVRSLDGLPLTFPTTTGVAAPLTGGVLALPPLPRAAAV
ncbi:MAG: anhydro-N-acetylmuramic acid kinase [Variibacter sp.]|nr:anhydro-N-acetylmuramic acid kinase [Variibacter sp.]